MTEPEKNYELLYEGLINKISIKKFRSKRTDIKVVFADVEGPLVQGFFCLSTKATDNDGLPHTLEHVIFLGSEDYPYKGILDKVATRCLSEGTNAWTDKDNTCYTITTAGSDGFLNLLPVFLDHILYPVLSDSAFITEIHHITEEGKDAGVVYSEMQAVENTGSNKVYLEMLRGMYPSDCGYQFETGGILENLRTSTTNIKVRNFHKEFYKPKNLCLIVTGKVNQGTFFKVLSNFEDKIISKGKREVDFQRPWMDPIKPLTSEVVKRVKYPSDDSDEGLVYVAWRGPQTNDQLNITACTMLMEYFTESPVSLMSQTFVEIPEPYCGEVDYALVENSESAICFEFESVNMKLINDVRPRLLSLFERLANGTLKFDMNRMKIVIENRIVDLMSQLEDQPHDTVANIIIADFLYGITTSDFEARLNRIDIMENLISKDESFWISLMQSFFPQKQNVTVIGEPSPDEVKKNSAEERKRIKQRQKDIGTIGLKQKKEILIKAISENNRGPPDELLTKFKIPDTKELHHHSITSYSNSHQYSQIGAKISQEDFLRIPCQFQLDDIETEFVNINLCFDLKNLNPALAVYLPLFIELLFESPIIRNGVTIPYEEVVQQLSGDTIDYSSSIGIQGSRFQPGEFSNSIVISLKVKMKKLETGLKWCGEFISGISFTADRILMVAKKLASDIKQMRREADVVVEALTVSNLFVPGSMHQLTTFLAQEKFLKDVLSSKKINMHIASLKAIQDHLRILDCAYIHMSTDLSKLMNHLNGSLLSDLLNMNFTSLLWKKNNDREETNSSDSFDVFTTNSWSLKKDSSLIEDLSKLKSCIVGLGSTDSAYMIKVCSCINDFNHPDVPALLVFCHFVSFLDGPMWTIIRGKGLAYSFSLTPDFNEGLLYFQIEQSSNPYEAYKQAINLFKNIISGIRQISQMELECAQCQCIYELIQAVQTPSMASKQAFSCFMRSIPLDYYSCMLEKVKKVTINELQMIAQSYISNLIDPKTSRMFMACNIKEMSKLLNNMQTMNQEKFLAYKTVNSISVKS